MLYCLVERNKEGGRQLNRVNLPLSLDCCRGWESTRLFFEAGVISKELSKKYAYISEYDPLDWIEEEQEIKTDGPYYLNS